VFCLWIPSLAILFGPVYHEFYRHSMESKEVVKDGLGDLTKVNEAIQSGKFRNDLLMSNQKRTDLLMSNKKSANQSPSDSK
jgi:hypothetical protein